MSSLHATLGQVAAFGAGLIGFWGLFLSRRDSPPPRIFFWAVGAGIVVMLAQVILGVTLMSVEEIDPGNQHVFYGVVIAATFAFAYIYRAQFRERPALYYGSLMLFTMGLGIRGIMTFGVNF